MIERLVLLKIQNMMEISLELLQLFIKVLMKNLPLTKEHELVFVQSLLTINYEKHYTSYLSENMKKVIYIPSLGTTFGEPI